MIFVKVCDGADADSEECIELPVEPEGYILMSTLIAQYPGACGLKFKTEHSSWRGVRVVEDKIYPPGEDKWDENMIYHVTYPKDSKRKGDDLDVNSAKSRKIEKKCVDLIVLGIPWKSPDEVVRRYFEQYGEVVLCEIKRDAANNSKGFGFVRFKEYDHQCLVLGKKHFIDGRWCDVKIPNSQEPETSRKIFVGRLTESLTSQDLQDYFSKFGQVIDVYIPKPFRAFGFVTFVEADVARSLCGESHIIKGVSVHVSRADPKDDDGEPGVGGAAANSGSYGGANGSSHHHGGGHGHHHHHQGGMSRSQSHYSNNHSFSPNYVPNGYRDVPRSNKSMNPSRNKSSKIEHHIHDGHDNRQNNGMRSGGGASGPVFNPNHQSNSMGQNDAMSMMSNMFNPMMAAFLQQLAAQTQSMQSPNGSVPFAPSMLDSSPASGVPPPQAQWNHHAHHHQPPMGLSQGFSGAGLPPPPLHHPRFKNDKKF